jgi:integrase
MAKYRAHGEGTLYQRADGRWAAQITLPDGQRKTKYGKGQKEVRDWLTAERQAIRTQAWTSDERLTVADFLTRYLSDVAAPTVRPRTLEGYTWLIHNHIKPALGDVRLVRLSPQRVQSFYADRLKAGLSSTTVNHIHNVLHKALEQAVRWGMVPRNVTDLVDAPQTKRRTATVWTAEQARAFIEASRSHRLHALYVLAIYTGMRQGELLGLQMDDIDWASNTLNIRHSLQTLQSQPQQLSTPKTEKSKRLVTLPAPASAALEAHIKRQERKQGYVFVSLVETPLRPHSVIDTFKRIASKVGLPEIRFHDLRHTCATLHLLNGTNPKIVQDLLGHSTITLTLDTYSHVMPGMQQDAADRLGKLLGG